jgi:hypothetical protein
VLAAFDAPSADRENAPVQEATTLGVEFARALAEKDSARIRDVLHPAIDFRGLTPGRTWEASDRDAVIALLFDQWFEETDEIKTLERLESDTFADCQRVGYRFSVSNPDGDFLVEQQAYISDRDGQIGWMRVVCSGYRPTASPE